MPGQRGGRQPKRRSQPIEDLIGPEPLEALQRLVERREFLATDPADPIARDAKLDAAGFENVLKLRAEIEGQWGGKAPPIAKYIDLSFYDKALAGL